MDAIPLHVLSQHIASTNPDLDILSRLMCVNKEWHNELKPLLTSTAIQQLRHVSPKYMAILEEHASNDVATILTKAMVSVPSLIKVLKNITSLHGRKKGQRYKHLLDPMLNSSLLICDDDVTEEKITSTLMVLFALVAYVHQNYNGSEPTDVKAIFWPMYMTYDFLHHMYLKNKRFDILSTWLFRHCILMNIQELRTYPYKKYMGNARAYAFERMMQRLEYSMFSYLV